VPLAAWGQLGVSPSSNEDPPPLGINRSGLRNLNFFLHLAALSPSVNWKNDVVLITVFLT
jgi:hypothetical protein